MRLHHLIRHTVTALAACAALAVGPLARADTLNPTGYAWPPSQSFSLANGSTNLGSPNAGAFTGLLNGVPIVFFCVQLDQYFQFGGSYTYTDTLESAAPYTTLGRLYTHAFSQVDTPTES